MELGYAHSPQAPGLSSAYSRVRYSFDGNLRAPLNYDTERRVGVSSMIIHYMYTNGKRNSEIKIAAEIRD